MVANRATHYNIFIQHSIQVKIVVNVNLNFDLNFTTDFIAEEGFLEQSKPSTLNIENHNSLHFVY